MKFNYLIGSLVTLLSLSSLSLAAVGDYYPPERINCQINAAGKLSCDGFDRQYLSEDTFTADFPPNKDLKFYFVSGVAYYTPDTHDTSVYFSYRNFDGKVVKLRTIKTSIRPDVANGEWKQFKDEFYTCNAGYMSCPITDAPSA